MAWPRGIGERAAVITGIAFFAMGFVFLACCAWFRQLFLVATGVTSTGGASTPNLDVDAVRPGGRATGSGSRAR